MAIGTILLVNGAFADGSLLDKGHSAPDQARTEVELNLRDCQHRGRDESYLNQTGADQPA